MQGEHFKSLEADIRWLSAQLENLAYSMTNAEQAVSSLVQTIKDIQQAMFEQRRWNRDDRPLFRKLQDPFSSTQGRAEEIDWDQLAKAFRLWIFARTSRVTLQSFDVSVFRILK